MIKSLVTGGAGYFGDLLTRKLLDRGYFVRILDLNLPADSYPGTEVVQADIRDPHAVLPACEGIDVVYHNAAELSSGEKQRVDVECQPRRDEEPAGAVRALSSQEGDLRLFERSVWNS